jgi:hypothetical protein
MGPTNTRLCPRPLLAIPSLFSTTFVATGVATLRKAFFTGP